MWGRLASGIAVCLAVAIAAQVGYVGYRERGRAELLQQELAALAEQSGRSIRRLENQLETARASLGELRFALSDSEVANDSLESDLSLLQERVEALSDVLNEERPSLEVRLLPEDGLVGIVAVAENPGRFPVKILESTGLVWLGDQVDEAGDSTEPITVPAAGSVDFYSFELFENEPALVASGESLLRGALCLVQQRAVAEKPGSWVTEYWFEYQPRLERVAVLGQETRPLSLEEPACDLAASDPPW